MQLLQKQKWSETILKVRSYLLFLKLFYNSLRICIQYLQLVYNCFIMMQRRVIMVRYEFIHPTLKQNIDLKNTYSHSVKSSVRKALKDPYLVVNVYPDYFTFEPALGITLSQRQWIGKNFKNNLRFIKDAGRLGIIIGNHLFH